VRFAPERAQLVGVSPGNVRRAATTLVQGMKVGEIYEDQKVFDVVVRGAPGVRDNIEAVRRLPIQTPGGGIVPLSATSEVAITATPNEITREGGSRRLDVTCNVRGRDLGGVATDIRTALAGLQFPAEYHAELLGEYAEREESRQRLLTIGAFALNGRTGQSTTKLNTLCADAARKTDPKSRRVCSAPEASRTTSSALRRISKVG